MVEGSGGVGADPAEDVGEVRDGLDAFASQVAVRE